MSTQVTANPELAARFKLERLVKIREVELLTGQDRQTLWRKARQGKFPKPRKLGTLNVWPESEIRAWIARVLEGREEADTPKPIPPQLKAKANGPGEPAAPIAPEPDTTAKPATKTNRKPKTGSSQRRPRGRT